MAYTTSTVEQPACDGVIGYSPPRLCQPLSAVGSAGDPLSSAPVILEGRNRGRSGIRTANLLQTATGLDRSAGGGAKERARGRIPHPAPTNCRNMPLQVCSIGNILPPPLSLSADTPHTPKTFYWRPNVHGVSRMLTLWLVATQSSARLIGLLLSLSRQHSCCYFNFLCTLADNSFDKLLSI